MVTRDLALTELNFRGISINSTGGSATIAVVASDSGVIFVNKYTSNDTVYTLPAVADAKGKMFWFFNAQGTKSLNINAPVNTIFMVGDAASNSATSAAAIGEAAFVMCDGTGYYLFELVGAWGNA